MNSVLFDLGFVQIKWYSFFILVAVIIAYFIIHKEIKKKGIKEEDYCVLWINNRNTRC